MTTDLSTRPAMHDGHALIRTIEAVPEDDTPRLVYADWLDEQGTAADRARAAFVRLQCELARIPTGPGTVELSPRENELLGAAGGPGGIFGMRLMSYEFRRGFVDPLDFGKTEVFVEYADRLATVTPLHRLKLYQTPAAAERLAVCPQLGYVRDLDLSSNVIRNDHLAVLTGSPHLGNIQSLNLESNRVGADGCRALAAAGLPSLRALCLTANPIRDAGLAAVLSASWFPQLTDFWPGTITDRGAEALASSPAARGLRRLTMPAGLSPRGAAAIAASPFPVLEELAFAAMDRVPGILTAAARNPTLRRLRRFYITTLEPVAESEVRELLDSPYLAGLQRFYISRSDFSPGVRAELAARFGREQFPQ